MSNKERIVCVVGPTASGKSELAVKLCKALGGEAVSADSMQIYRDMHIASAAPDTEEMCGVPHHLIEFLDYKESFTVAQYVEAARNCVSGILQRGKLPVIVGGTGLYINSFVDNIEFVPQENTAELRERITKEFEDCGGQEMLSRLRALDSDAAEKLHANDKRRIIRAFEIYESTGLTPTEHNRISRQNETVYDTIMIGITYSDRQKLYDRINMRVDKMVENGLIEEARRAYERQSGTSAGAVQAIGHKEFFPYFDGEIEKDEAIELLKRSTRRYAKRQLTWFNRDSRINWIYRDLTPDVHGEALRILEERK